MRKLTIVCLVALLLVACCLSAEAASPLQDLVLTGGDHQISYSFTLEGYDSAKISFITVTEKGEEIIYPNEDGVFSGTLIVANTYPASNVQVSIQSANGKKTFLNREKVRTLFVVTEPAAQAEEGRLKGVTVCIDPGHQTVGVGGKKEPRGPGLSGTQSRAGQAQGVKTRRYEYIVTFEVAQQLRDALLAEGATVVMTKTDPEEYVSNVGRATVANDADADLFIRLHCNSNANSKHTGIVVYVPLHSDYAVAVADADTYLTYADALADAMTGTTGTKSHSIANDTYIASNWAMMPAFLVEMGYMSNPDEDVLLSDPDYQAKLIRGMVNGLYDVAVLRGVIPAE